MFQSGCANCFMPGTQPGDGGVRVNKGKNIFLGDSGMSRLTLDSVGNAEQPRSAGGMVKAMISYIGANDTIDKCFNSALGGSAATKPPCGFSKDKTGAGDYVFDFGFEVDDRLYSISPIGFQPSVDTLFGLLPQEQLHSHTDTKPARHHDATGRWILRRYFHASRLLTTRSPLPSFASRGRVPRRCPPGTKWDDSFRESSHAVRPFETKI